VILNSKNNQFVFRFPKGFIYPEIEEKYNYYLKRLPTPFENITDYVNHTIQSVTFPSVASDEIEQWVGRKTGVDGKNITKNPQYWRQSLDLDRVVPKEFTVNLKTADGYLNYWVLFETYRYYLTVPNTEDYFPDLNLMYLDRDGYQMLTVDFRQPLMKGISEVEMNYSATAMEFRTFAVNFKYNTFDINIKLD
jgi:hypothetical protein